MINMTKVFFRFTNKNAPVYNEDIIWCAAKGGRIMYEALYASVPDADAYLKRIQRKRRDVLTKEYLDDLIYGHQLHVPFENLDVWMFQKDIPLDIEAIYEKVVTKHRGGYCFELNALFTALLKDLGFHASSCMCRITRNKNYVPLVLHRGIIVELDGMKYFCDVGYGGPMPPGAVPVQDGAVADMRGERYYMYKDEVPWWTMKRRNSSGEIESMLQFYTMPQEAVDYIPMNEYCSKNENSVFRQRLYLNKRTERGSVSVMGNRFTEVENGVVVQEMEIGEEEMKGVLERYFEIVL